MFCHLVTNNESTRGGKLKKKGLGGRGLLVAGEPLRGDHMQPGGRRFLV